MRRQIKVYPEKKKRKKSSAVRHAPFGSMHNALLMTDCNLLGTRDEQYPSSYMLHNLRRRFKKKFIDSNT